MTRCSSVLTLSTGEEHPCRRTDEHSGEARDSADYHSDNDDCWHDASPGARRLRLREGDQPLPEPRPDQPAIQDLVIADIERRKQLGLQRYGTLLKAGNGRDMLQDAFDEALDLVIYLKGALVERDGIDPAATAD